MRAIRFDGRAPLLDLACPEPLPKPGEALIRPARVGIGAPDRAVIAGAVGFTGILGHEFVGVVERVHGAPGKDDQKKWEGKRIVGGVHIVCGRCDLCRGGLSTHCQARAVLGLHLRDGCLAERFTLPVANLVEVPRGVDDDAAVFAQPLAAVLHAAHMIRIEGKPYVTILGDGPLGLLAAQVMTRLNASVRVLGKHAEKYTLCEKWGIKHRHIDECGRRQDQDIVVDCTGAPPGLELAMQMVRPRGKIIVMTAPAPVPMAGMRALPSTIDLSPMVVNELEVIGARCGSLADAVGALARREVDVLSLISRRFKLADGVRALGAAAEAGVLRVVVEV